MCPNHTSALCFDTFASQPIAHVSEYHMSEDHHYLYTSCLAALAISSTSCQNTELKRSSCLNPGSRVTGWKRPRDKPHTRWLSAVERDLQQLRVSIEDAEVLVKYRLYWKALFTLGGSTVWMVMAKKDNSTSRMSSSRARSPSRAWTRTRTTASLQPSGEFWLILLQWKRNHPIPKASKVKVSWTRGKAKIRTAKYWFGISTSTHIAVARRLFSPQERTRSNNK